MRPPTRLWTIVVLCAFVAAQLGAAAHYVATPHSVCEAHGELTHGEGGHDGHATEAHAGELAHGICSSTEPDPEPAGETVRPDGETGSHHDHCSRTFTAPRSRPVSPPSTGPGRPILSAIPASPAIPQAPIARIARYLTAPKQSPPAFA